MRGGEYTPDEKNAVLEYCESDVIALQDLLPKMLVSIDLPRALLRGRYMAACAVVEQHGIPLDKVTLKRLLGNWNSIQLKLIESVDAHYGVYDGATFKAGKFANYLKQKNISWPTHDSGALKLDDETFKYMAHANPIIKPLRELRRTIAELRKNDIVVGNDGSSRFLLSAFRSKTGRNQPSSSKFIFGQPKWLRGLIKPPGGFGIAYIDWEQQEFGIAAALSGDKRMMEAYHSGDPYLEFAKQAGAVPADATKQSHKAERDKFKACVLAVQYGMGAKSLAARIGCHEIEAEQLLNLHRRTYYRFWEWSEAALNYSLLNRQIHTRFGWKLLIGDEPNPRTIQNFPMQANGAEMMRLACIFGLEKGIKICAPVHDAFLVEAPVEKLDEHIATMKDAMLKASQAVLDGFDLRAGVEKFIYPERYMDEDGKDMWHRVMSLLPG